MVSDSLFVGESTHIALEPLANPRQFCGLAGPMSSFLTVKDSRFSRFPVGTGLCVCALCFPPKGGQEIRTSGLTFDADVVTKVYFKTHFTAMLYDVDGSLTGSAGSWMHGAAVDGGLGYFPPSDCATTALGMTGTGGTVTDLDDPKNNPIRSALLCSPSVSLRTFRINSLQDQIACGVFPCPALVSSQFGSSIVPWEKYDINHRADNYHWTLVTGLEHTVSWFPYLPYAVDFLGWGHAELCELREGESFSLSSPTMTDPSFWIFEESMLNFKEDLFGPMNFETATNGFMRYTDSVYDEDSQSVTTPGMLDMFMSSMALTTNGSRTRRTAISDGTAAKPACNTEKCHIGQRCITADLERNDCPLIGCFSDDDLCLGDKRPPTASGALTAANWCVAGSIDGWTVPEAGDDVNIPSGVEMVLDGCTTAIVNRLDICKLFLV